VCGGWGQYIQRYRVERNMRSNRLCQCQKCGSLETACKYRVRDGKLSRCCRAPLEVIPKHRKRQVILRQLGFNSYREYLESDLWQGIRERVFEKQGANCKRCGERATQIHHRRYSHDVLSGESLSGLTPICRSCHQFIEFKADGQKGSLYSANRKLDGKPSAAKRSRPGIGKSHAKKRKR